MRYIILFVFACLFSFSVQAQDPNLAQQYYSNGEYEKAAQLYERLFNENEGNDYFFERYVECLVSMTDYDKAKKVVEKQIRKRSKESSLYVTYGSIFEQEGDPNSAKEQYEKAIAKLVPDKYQISKLANNFYSNQKFDYAIQSYEKGEQLLKDKYTFAYNLGELYRAKGDIPKMIDAYLNSIIVNPGYISTVKVIFQRYLSEEDYPELQTQLYARVQENTNVIEYPELLTWVFLQRKDYKNAFRQAKALDKKLEENGGRVYNIAEIALQDKDFEAAISGYDYIVVEKGKLSTYYLDAKRNSLVAKRLKITEGQHYTTSDLRILEKEYEDFLTEFGRNKTSATIVAELANLEAFYIKDLDKAVKLLEESIAYPGINRTEQAQAKLSLGDFYVIKGDIWEAVLLYSQVDKDFKDDILGHEARFRNAKLSYYNGDFQWAQAQFDGLKASTSKLIANDALDLSVFILDNLGLDTIARPLEMYAKADLLIFQNRFDEAESKLDSLRKEFPEHSLEDDLLWLEAQIELKKRNYTQAADIFKEIIEKHKEEIRADNALFALAELYETKLNQPDKAKELYEKLFTEFSNSTLSIDARKRFRALRGDKLEN